MLLKELKTLLMDKWDKFKYFVSKEYSVIIKIIYCIIIALGCKIPENKLLSVFILIILYIVQNLLINVLDNMNNKNNIPKLTKRLTTMDEKGNIAMKKVDTNKAIIYLYNIEEYLIKHGHRYLMILLTVSCLLIPCIKTFAVELTEEEQVLLQQVAIAEANNQGVGGMAFVMQTICNRIESDKFPNTLKEVIYQSGQFECTKKNIENIKITNNSQCALEYKDILINAGQLYFENNHGNGNTWHQSNLEFLFEHLDHCFYK